MRVDIHNKDFQNWIKGVLALNTTRDALVDTLREKVGSFVLKYEKSDIQTFANCLESNHNTQLKTKKKSGKQREKVENRTYTCEHKQCQKLFDDFVDKHKGIQKKNFKWYLKRKEENTNEENRVEKNTNEHETTEENTNKEKKVGENTNKFELTEGKTETLWQILRLYMFYEGEHVAKYKGLDDLDISILIKIMKNCAICEADGDPKLYEKVLEFRNEMMHSPDNIITTKYLQKKLEEASSLIQLLSTDDQVTPISHRLEGAVQYLENLGENEFQISFPFEEYQPVFREAKQILEDKPNREGLKQLQEHFKTNTPREPTDISKTLVGKPSDFKVLVKNCIEKKKKALELDIALRSQEENADHEIEQDWNDINEELKKTEEEDPANLLECLRKENATIKTERDKAFQDNADLNKENERLKRDIRYLEIKAQVKEMEIDSLKKQLSKKKSKVSWTHYCILIGVMYAVIELTFAERVSSVPCSNGGTECDDIDHATCGTTDTCECETGYDEDLNDGSTCVQVVSEVACTITEPCTGIANTECSSDKCKCKDGFKELANTCVKVFGSDCSGSNPCPGLEHSVCTDSKCACEENYEEKNDVCTLIVSAVPCTGTEPCTGIANTECSGDKCKCKDGFKELANTCVKVFGSACSESDLCTGLEHSVCTYSKCACEEKYEEKNDVCTLTVNETPCTDETACDSIANAECDETAAMCKCSDGYVMNVDVCDPENGAVNETPCTDETACDSIANAECDETAEMCKCSDGYVMNVDVCDPENGAATLKIEAATLVLFIILTALQMIG